MLPWCAAFVPRRHHVVECPPWWSIALVCCLGGLLPWSIALLVCCLGGRGLLPWWSIALVVYCLGGVTLASRHSMLAAIDESGSVETNAIARVPFERQIDLVHRQGS